MPYPFTIKGEPYVPSARPEIVQGEKAEVCLVGYNLGDGELEFDSHVVDLDGERVGAGALLIEERTVTGIEGLDKLTASFDSAGLAAGDYRLRVSVRGTGTADLVYENDIPFVVQARSGPLEFCPWRKLGTEWHSPRWVGRLR